MGVATTHLSTEVYFPTHPLWPPVAWCCARPSHVVRPMHVLLRIRRGIAGALHAWLLWTALESRG